MIRQLGFVLLLVGYILLGVLLKIGYDDYFYHTENIISPPNRIDEDDIQVYDHQFKVSKLRWNLTWTRFAGTDSMKPSINNYTNGIMITPKEKEEIKEGDIIAFERGGIIIIHRVIDLDDDGEWYAITKGDNVNLPDPYKVRFDDIKGVIIALVY